MSVLGGSTKVDLSLLRLSIVQALLDSTFALIAAVVEMVELVEMVEMVELVEMVEAQPKLNRYDKPQKVLR